MTDVEHLAVPAVTPEALSPGEGWGVLHLFFRSSPLATAHEISAAIEACRADGHQVVTFAVLGHKADLGVLAIGPNLWTLKALQAGLCNAGLELVDSYVSMTEVSEYAMGMPPEMLKARLYPELPPAGMRSMCFYPMSKRRGVGAEDANWFTLPFDDRQRLMHEHGTSGRKFAGRIAQFITGSTGLDDYEWGVTLFAHDPADLKQVVYTMRFDEGSAKYADFGPFLTCLIGTTEEVLSNCGIE